MERFEFSHETWRYNKIWKTKSRNFGKCFWIWKRSFSIENFKTFRAKCWFNYDRKWKKNHYAVTSNLSRLLSNQVSRHKEPKFFCRRCLNHFSSQEKLKTHLESCEQFGFLKIEMPKEGEKLKFKIFKDKWKCHLLFMQILNLL